MEESKIRDVSIVDSKFHKSDEWFLSGLRFADYQNLIYYDPPLHRRLISLFISIRPEALSGRLWLLFKHPMFSEVKSMFICSRSIENFSFGKYINPHFQQLEELSCLRLKPARTTFLNLPNLKVLSLFSLLLLRRTRTRLKLPRMYKLLTNVGLGSLKFVHLNSLLLSA